jgi:3-phenylpropionate/cinnamic acid dioxygenase small subunit
VTSSAALIDAPKQEDWLRMFCHDVQYLMDLLVEQDGNIMAEPAE